MIMRKPPYIRDVERVVAKKAGIPASDLNKRTRLPDAVDARQLIWLVATDYFGLPSTHIASMYERDHTTVIHGVKKMRAIPSIKNIVNSIRRECPESFDRGVEKAKRRGLERWNWG